MLVYLHGFASGPGSTKATWFRERLAAMGRELVVPDLAPDFTTMTVTSQLAIVEPLLPAVLLGSSLGGYLAALAAETWPDRVRALVLLAPAVGFLARWEARVGAEGMAQWRADGTIPVHHYGTGRDEPLGIGLLDDAARYPALPDPRCPTLVLAGRHDDAVPLAEVERFAAARPGRELVVYDTGHELIDVLEPMWERITRFLGGLGLL